MVSSRSTLSVPASRCRLELPQVAPEEVEALAARAQQLAEGWDHAAGEDEVEKEAEVQVPDDSGVDHSGDSYDS